MCLGRFRNSGVSELVHKTERLRATNRALHCAVRRHFVSDLLAMRLHSMSANASACFSLRLRSARVPGFTLQSNGTAFAVQNPRMVSIKKTSRTEFNLSFLWWRCGVCLTAIVTKGQSRAAEGVHTATPCCDFSKSQ